MRKQNKNKSVEKRIKALLLYAAGEKCEKIAVQTGFVKSYIGELVSRYRRLRISVISGENYGGNHRNLSYEEEEAALKPYCLCGSCFANIHTEATTPEIAAMYIENHGQYVPVQLLDKKLTLLDCPGFWYP